jgi:hypothetical protein
MESSISNCNVMFGDVDLIFNMSVDLTLKFQVDTLVESGDTIEFSLYIHTHTHM